MAVDRDGEDVAPGFSGVTRNPRIRARRAVTASLAPDAVG
jgi:hypothetical protein